MPEAVAGVVYLPPSGGRDLTADVLGRAFAVTELRPGPRAAPRPRRRPAERSSPAREHGVWVNRLPGADVLVYRKVGVPLVTLGIYVPRRQFDPPAQAGLGSLLVRAAVRGAGELDAAALAFAFERLGGTLGTSSASDWLGFGASVLSENLAEAAALLDSVFSQPHLNDADVTAERGLMIAEAERVADDMFRYPVPARLLRGFGDRGYGLPVGGLPETLPGHRGGRPRLARRRDAATCARSWSPWATWTPSARRTSWRVSSAGPARDSRPRSWRSRSTGWRTRARSPGPRRVA